MAAFLHRAFNEVGANITATMPLWLPRRESLPSTTRLFDSSGEEETQVQFDKALMQHQFQFLQSWNWNE